MALVERGHRVIDPAMALAVEILGAQKVGDFDDGVGVDHQRTQDSALGFDIGGYTFERYCCRCFAIAILHGIVHANLLSCLSNASLERLQCPSLTPLIQKALVPVWISWLQAVDKVQGRKNGEATCVASPSFNDRVWKGRRVLVAQQAVQV